MPTEPRLKMLAGHDADLGFAGGDDAGAVRPDAGGTWSRPARDRYLHHVEHRNALGDADDQRDLRRRSASHDGVGGARRRHIDHRGVGAGLRRAPRRRCRTPGRAEMGARRPCPARCRRPPSSHRPSACSAWKVPFLPVKPWVMSLGVFIDEDGHHAASFTALTIFGGGVVAGSSAGDDR